MNPADSIWQWAAMIRQSVQILAYDLKTPSVVSLTCFLYTSINELSVCMYVLSARIMRWTGRRTDRQIHKQYQNYYTLRPADAECKAMDLHSVHTVGFYDPCQNSHYNRGL